MLSKVERRFQLSVKKAGTRTTGVLQEMRRNYMSYIYLLPFMVIFFMFTLLPVVTSIYYSMTYYNILEEPQWIGFRNYINLFLHDDIFIIAVKNTFVFAAITGPIGYILALLFAWFINELPPRIRAVMVLVFYAPTISGQIYLIWALLFSGDSYGYINGFLTKLGIFNEPVQWLTDPRYMMNVIILVALWMSLGAGFLSFIAGLQNIDKALYEAGCVDGIKNRWQELWFITLPTMRPQLMFGAVMSVTSSFAAADIMTALAGFPSTDYAAHTIVTHLQDYGGIRYEMGYACAIATLLFVVMVSINKLVQSLLRKVGN